MTIAELKQRVDWAYERVADPTNVDAVVYDAAMNEYAITSIDAGDDDVTINIAPE